MSNIFLNEDEVKEYVEQWLKNEKGYKKVDVNYGRKQGIDIKAYAQENIGEWVIEAKGSGNNKKKYPLSFTNIILSFNLVLASRGSSFQSLSYLW